jgi:tRNA(Ile)-lysidine synthase
MAASPTPRPSPADPGPNPALAALQGLKPALPLGVAFSGGADSTALLHAAAACWPGQVHAIHVNHGLQAAAGEFEAQCERTCAALQVPLHAVQVQAHHGPGESPEDAARRARYQALAEAARQHGLRTVLLAQHADDQVETLLLALSRGAGLPGLAGMAAAFERDGMRFERPMLQVAGPAIRQWLQAAAVPFAQDPSNADQAFTRNRIRHQLLPALELAFPSFRETFARSARHAAQAQELLAALAQGDLAAMGGHPHIPSVRQLPRGRQANVLRHWLREGFAAAPSAAQLEELLDQLAACATRGHAIRIKVAAGFVVREGDRLAYLPSV